MSLTDENGNMSTTMLVSPTGGVPYAQGGGFGNSFGGDWGWQKRFANIKLRN